MKKKLLDDLIKAGWKCYYKNDKFAIISKYSKDSKGKWYIRDLKEAISTPFCGIGYIVVGIVLIFLFPFQLISILWSFIPSFTIVEDKENKN